MSYFQINFVNFVLCGIFTFLIAAYAFLQKSSQLSREKSSKNLTTVSYVGAYGGDIEMIKVATADATHVTGIEITFKSLTVTARSDSSMCLLDDVSGNLEAGTLVGNFNIYIYINIYIYFNIGNLTLVGIMGPCGCGKSTLISALRSGGAEAKLGRVQSNTSIGLVLALSLLKLSNLSLHIHQ